MTGRKKRTGDNAKLTKVLSTKLSTKYHNTLEILKNEVYRKGGIDQPTVSEFNRFILVHFVDETRSRQGLSALRNMSDSKRKSG
jgi:hypothetical protein